MKKYFLLLATLLLSLTASAQDAITVSTTPADDSFTLVGTDQSATFLLDAADAEVVMTAANCVAEDIKAVTGQTVTVGTGSITSAGSNPVIYVGTVGTPLISQLAEDGTIDISEIEGRWEVYSLQRISEDKLAIIGSTPRGTAYGLFELSRLISNTPRSISPERRWCRKSRR